MTGSARSGSTKRDIVVAAALLFTERGYAAVRVRDIADRVGITAGAIYQHFPSKEAVLEAVLLETIVRWLQVASASGGAVGASGSIVRLVEASVRLVVERPGPLATYVRERSGVDRSTSRQLARRERELFTAWSDAIVAARPGLPLGDIVVRQRAIHGVLSALAMRPGRLAQPRLRALVVEGLVAVATAAPMAPVEEPASKPALWRAPMSRREQIMTVAMRLFAERGFHGVTMDDIGEAVGIAAPSLYEHVAGKADILVDAYDRAGAFVVAGAATAVAAATSAADALDGLIRSYVEVAFAHVDLLVVTTSEGASLPTSERARLVRRRRDVQEQWAGVLREVRGGMSPSDARALVRCALAMVGAVARQRRLASPSIDATVELTRALLSGTASTDPPITAITRLGSVPKAKVVTGLDAQAAGERSDASPARR